MTNTKKQYKKRKNQKSKMYKRISRRHHKMCRSVVLATLNSTTAGFFSFAMSDLSNYSEFQSLFDSFKIYGIQLKFIPSQINAETGSSTAGVSQLLVANDFDGTSPPTTDAGFFERDHKLWFLNRPKKWYIRPRVLNSVYEGVAATSYNPKANVWLDCAEPDTPHYGVAYKLRNLATNATVTVVATYYLELKEQI